jgi:hypothetical protein
LVPGSKRLILSTRLSLVRSIALAQAVHCLSRSIMPHGSQTIVSVGPRTSDRVKASFGIRER